MSLCAGVVSWIFTALDPPSYDSFPFFGAPVPSFHRWFPAVILSLIVSLLYACLGALFVFLCESFRNFAHKNKIKHSSRIDRIVLASFWPLTLPWCLILYSFLAIIDRIFPDSD